MSLELINSKVDLVKKILPSGTEKALEGKTTMDANFTQIAEQVAYNALGHASVKIADALVKPPAGTAANIMIVDKGVFPSGEIPLFNSETDWTFTSSCFRHKLRQTKNSWKKKSRCRKPKRGRWPFLLQFQFWRR